MIQLNIYIYVRLNDKSQWIKSSNNSNETNKIWMCQTPQLLRTQTHTL